METLFTTVYDRFLGKITDDMYLELTPEDTIKDLKNLLVDAIPGFEFPRVNLQDYTISIVSIPKEEATEDDFIINSDDINVLVDKSHFNIELSSEEINILALLMK